MEVRLLDLRPQYAAIRDEIREAIDRVCESQHFILGPEVAEFESEVAEYCGTRCAVGMSSGTDALLAALMAIGVGPGDEVITTTYSFFASAAVIVRLGARPVFVDIDPVTYNLDPEAAVAKITPRTKAIMPVHLYGRPADMAPINAAAEAREVTVIEDAAQALSASDRVGRKAGALGHMGCFSFFPSKNLGCYGDGGMVTTDSDAMAGRLRSLRNHGSSKRYYHDEIGYNSRLDELQAGILRLKLKRIETYNMKRRSVATRYSELLSGIPGVKTPAEKDGYFHVYHQYTIITERRDEVMRALADKGIASAVYYPVPLHLQPSYAALGHGKGDFPVAERLAERVLSLPMFPELKQEDVDLVCETIRSCF